MSEFEISIPIDGSQYNERIIINKYGDQYSLVLGREAKGNGTVYMQWGFPADKDKKPREKSIPWKIPLGNYVQAQALLRKLLAVFVADQRKPQAVDKALPIADDVPF